MEEFFNWIGNALIDFFEWIGGALVWILDAIAAAARWWGDFVRWLLGGLWDHVVWPLLRPTAEWLWEQIQPVIQPVLDVIEIVRLVVEVVFEVIAVVWDYAGEALRVFWAIMEGIRGAPPTPLPGMPQCVSAPLDHQICALWYMIDWTIIADGTPGARLVPIVILMIDLVIVVYVIRSMLDIVKSFETFFQV